MDSNVPAVQAVRAAMNEDADYRRQIAELSAVGLLDFSIISLYQLGVIKKLPDLPGKLFDSNMVNASPNAQIFGLPDAPVNLALYAANLVLASGGIKNGKKGNFFDWLLAGSVLGQAAGGAYYLYIMATEEKKVCAYCITGALVSFLSLSPLAKLFFKK